MRNAGRNAMGVLVAALAMLGSGRAAAHDERLNTSDERAPTIVLHVVNRAAISREVLNQVEDHVASVYEGIGVRTVWVDSERGVGKHLDNGLHLTVMLLSHTIAKGTTSVKGISDDALGRAHPGIGRAYIFCDRVASMPGAKFFVILLGTVIAHEVGHLLLPEKGHSREGIMRAEIDVQHAIHFQSFDKSQVNVIRKVLSELASGAPEQ